MNLSSALYAALSQSASVTQYLGEYNGGLPSIFTKLPVEEGATYPMIVSAGNVAVANADYLSSEYPVVTRDITVYALQDSQYRNVENCAEAIKALFHRKRHSLNVTGYSVLDVTASGPANGPVEDVTHVSRIVTLTIRLRKNLA